MATLQDPVAGNKILPLGTAYSATCPMIYHSVNINWWWWSRITQTSGSSAGLFSYFSHLPSRHTSGQKCRLFASLKINPHGKHFQPSNRKEKKKRSFELQVLCKLQTISFFLTVALAIPARARVPVPVALRDALFILRLFGKGKGLSMQLPREGQATYGPHELNRP